MATLKESVKRRIAEGKTAEVLEVLFKHTYTNVFTLLKGQYVRNETEKNKGISDRKEYNQERNKIEEALLGSLDDIDVEQTTTIIAQLAAVPQTDDISCGQPLLRKNRFFYLFTPFAAILLSLFLYEKRKLLFVDFEWHYFLGVVVFLFVLTATFTYFYVPQKWSKWGILIASLLLMLNFSSILYDISQHIHRNDVNNPESFIVSGSHYTPFADSLRQQLDIPKDPVGLSESVEGKDDLIWTDIREVKNKFLILFMCLGLTSGFFSGCLGLAFLKKY